MSQFEMPNSYESERIIIGSALIDGQETMKRISHLITFEDFYDKTNQVVYRAIEKLHREAQAIDVISVYDTLRERGYADLVGGPAALTEMTIDVVTVTHVLTHAKIVAKHSTLRRILQAAKEIANLSQQEHDLDELLTKAEQVLHGVTRSQKAQADRLKLVDLDEWMTIARDSAPPEGSLRGMSLGFKGIDDMTEGFEAGEMMILTGHTKHGKSKLAQNFAYKLASQGKRVLLVNTEMTKLQVARRFVDLMGPEDLPGKIKLNDRGDLAHRDVIRMMEGAKEWGCDIVIVDHLHFFSRSVENQTSEISRITKEFKEAAVQYELPLILLAHVQQADTKKKPTLQMLKNSSSIAQDADIVIAVWRDDRPDSRDPNTTEVIRLAARSAARNHTRTMLYADGIKFGEDKPPETEQRQDWVASAARITGEKDEADFYIPGQ